VTTEPISESVAKAHLRLEDDDPFISRLSGAITAARQTVEQYLNATVANRTRTLVLDDFPGGGRGIRLPDGPVTAVTEIAYLDTSGDDQTVAAHRLVNYPLTDVLTPAYGESWPTVRDVRGAVTISYTAGMMAGSPLTLDHEDIVSGILLTLGDLWENREGQFVNSPAQINRTVANLLHFHRRDLGT
jgi:uncharacterized phiE125 gp8 family phage protein